MKAKENVVRFLMVSCSILLLSLGCTKSTGIVPDGEDAFRVMHTGDTGFTNSGTFQKNAYQEASVFCAEKGMVVETIDMESKQARPFGGWPEATLLFRCSIRK